MEDLAQTSKPIPNPKKTFTIIARILSKTNGKIDQAITRLQSIMSDELIKEGFSDNLAIGDTAVLQQLLSITYKKFKDRTTTSFSLNSILKIRFAKFLSWHLIDKIDNLSHNVFNEILLIITTLLKPLKIAPTKTASGKKLKANNSLYFLWIFLANECPNNLGSKRKYGNKAIKELHTLIAIRQAIILKSETNNISDSVAIKLQEHINALIDLHNQLQEGDTKVIFDQAEQKPWFNNNYKILKILVQQIHILGKQKKLEDLIEMAVKLVIEIDKQIKLNPIAISDVKLVYKKTLKTLYLYLKNNPNLLCKATHSINELVSLNFISDMAQLIRNHNDLSNAKLLLPASTATVSRKLRRVLKSRKKRLIKENHLTDGPNHNEKTQLLQLSSDKAENNRAQNYSPAEIQSIYLLNAAKLLLQKEKYNQAIETLKKITKENRLIYNYKTYLMSLALCRLAHKIYLEKPDSNYKSLLNKAIKCIQEVIESENQALTEEGLCYCKCIAMLKKCSMSYIYSFASQCRELLSQQKVEIHLN